MAAIKLNSDEQLRRLIDALASELVDANIHWKLRKDLLSQTEGFSREYNQSTAFWSLTFQAHLDSTIFRLIRIYDGNSASLSIRNLLDTVSANVHFFDVDRFKERLKNNPFVDSLAEDARRPDEAQLRADSRFASNDNPLVRKLTVWRNNLFAHRSAEHVVTEYSIEKNYPLSEAEVEQLLKEGMAILNRYSSLFQAGGYSTKIVGDDDYSFVLQSIRVHLEKMDSERSAELIALAIQDRKEP